MATIKIDVAQWPRHVKKIGMRVFEAAHRGIVSGAHRCVPLLQRRAEQAAPASARGQVGAFNTGNYRRRFCVRVFKDGAAIFNDAPYAAVIDDGRRRNKRMPPKAAIARWAQRRIGLTEQEAKRAAFPIARAIGRRGLKPRRVMSGAHDEMRRIVNKEVEREIAKELSRR